MKLDLTALRYMGKEEFRVLTAVEMGMKNHEVGHAPSPAGNGRRRRCTRALTHAELQVVPTTLIARIAGLRSGAFKVGCAHSLPHHEPHARSRLNCTQVIKELHKHKLIYHDASKCEAARLVGGCFSFQTHAPHRADDGYRLTYLGYDFLAVKTLVQRGLISGVGRRIGVGKESGALRARWCKGGDPRPTFPDIYEVFNDEGKRMVLKVAMLTARSRRVAR
jgi:RIO kinase 2